MHDTETLLRRVAELEQLQGVVTVAPVTHVASADLDGRKG
jgi:hypothetical protein